jgi:hypothetical protein
MSHRSRFWALAALASVFVAGAACGVLADRLLLGREPERAAHALPDPLARLGVSADQRRAIDAVFERHRAEFDLITRDIEPRLRAVGDAIDRDIAVLLTPEQRQRLEALRAETQRPELPADGAGAWSIPLHDPVHGSGAGP